LSREWIIRIVTTAIVVGVIVWIARNTYWEDSEVDEPLKGEALTNRYYALEHLLHSMGVRTDTAATLEAPAASTDVMLAGNVVADILKNRIESLEPWVESGGRLVVGARTLESDKELQRWSGISVRYDKPKTNSDPKKKTDTDGNKKTVILEKLNGDPECYHLTVGRNGAALPESLALCDFPNTFAMKTTKVPEWSLTSARGLQAARIAIGKGSLTVLPHGGIVAEKLLLKGDHARIFIAATGIKKDDHVWVYKIDAEEKLLPMLWRLVAPAILFLGAAACLLVLRQWPRFGTPLPTPQPVRRSLAEQLRAQAAFAWRTRRLATLRRAARRALDETGRKIIASYETLDVRRRAQALAEASGTDPQTLSAAMTDDALGAPPVQRTAIAQLQSTRRILLQRFRLTRKVV
jgi:hypothetical protein